MIDQEEDHEVGLEVTTVVVVRIEIMTDGMASLFNRQRLRAR